MAIPDVDVHPAATGAAAKLVSQHTKQSHPLVLYSGWFCPFVQRSWVALEELGLQYEYVEINPYKKEASFLELNPRGLVPTLGCPVDKSRSNATNGSAAGTAKGERLGDDGILRKPLIESNIICEYLDTYAQTHPDQRRSENQTVKSLFPDDLYDKAKMKIWIDFVGSRIVPAFHRLLQHQEKTSPYKLDDALHELRGHLKTWIREADPVGPYFASSASMGTASDGFCMADVTLAPWAVRLWVFEHYKGVKAIPDKGQGGEDEKLWDRWRKWEKAIAERKSVKETLSEKEYYLPLYQRYADDIAQSELAKATRQGRGVP